MLKEVLREMANGNVRSQADLARRLDIDQTMLSHMMRELTMRGYLTPLAASDDAPSDGCSLGCSGCKGCAIGAGQPTTPNGWVLTEKGRRLAGE